MIGRQNIAADPRDGMARWIRDDGSVRYVPATTLCWRPRYPQVRRAYREGCEITLRCGDCPGCREFEVLRLERRLVATYGGADNSSPHKSEESCSTKRDSDSRSCPKLYAVRVYCPKGRHASTARRLHKWRGVNIEPGFFRAGVDSFVVLSRDPSELVARLERRRFRVDVRPIGKLARARSWRDVARGLIVPRSSYGENINRFYRRGLAAAEKENWEVRKLDGYKPFHKATDPRVISESHGRLVPPRMWELPDTVSVDARKLIDKARSPEAVVEALRPVFELLDGMGKRGAITVAPTSPEQIERNRRAYQHVARVESEALVIAKPSEFLPPPFVGGVTELLDNSSSADAEPMSSIHSSGAPPPALEPWMEEELRAVEASRKARTEASALRQDKTYREAIARLRAIQERLKKDAET